MTLLAANISTRTLGVLRLHVDGRAHVWFGADGRPGENSRRCVDGFCELLRGVLGGALGGVGCVRVLGSAANAGLITRLHHLRFNGADACPRVQICAPSLCSSQHPEEVLLALWQPRPAQVPSYELTERDYPSYAVLDALRDNDGLPGEKCRRILHYHPAWPALSFPLTGDPHYACKLVGHIVDPRWFRSPVRPHRLGRLLSYLGVTPENAGNAYATDPAPPGRHFARFLDTLYAWCGRAAGPGATLASTSSSPGGFLRRVELACRDRVKGLLAATVRFVRFVVEVWLAGVSRQRPEVGFAPELFFKSGSEVEGYKKHCAALQLANV